jgi:hypothetical protein
VRILCCGSSGCATARWGVVGQGGVLVRVCAAIKTTIAIGCGEAARHISSECICTCIDAQFRAQSKSLGWVTRSGGAGGRRGRARRRRAQAAACGGLCGRLRLAALSGKEIVHVAVSSPMRAYALGSPVRTIHHREQEEAGGRGGEGARGRGEGGGPWVPLKGGAAACVWGGDAPSRQAHSVCRSPRQ